MLKLQIAIVEDEKEDQEQLREFLESDLEQFDCIFMDIKLGGKLDGMLTAKALRKRKIQTTLIF